VIILEFSCVNPKLNSIITDTDEKEGIICIWGDIGVGKSTLAFTVSLFKLTQDQKVFYYNTRPEFKINRFYQLMSHFRNFDSFNLIIYNINTLDELAYEILTIEFKILYEIKMFGFSKIKLIVIDEIPSLIRIERKSSSIRPYLKLSLILATLNYLIKKYQISVIIITQSTFKNELNNSIEVPYQNKIINYFSSFILKIERTLSPSERYLIIQKNNSGNLKKILCKLTEYGFE